MKSESHDLNSLILNDDELELLNFIRTALSEPNPDAAKQAATALKPVLADVCGRGLADRAKVWAALSQDEQARFRSLLG